MKYLKVTLALFIITLLFSATGVSAAFKAFNDITIPVFKGNYVSSQQDKSTNTYQYIEKSGCLDDWTGDGRVIMAMVHGVFSGMNDSAWVEALPDKKVRFNSNSTTIGGWKQHLESQKSLPSTASFWGIWTYD